MATTTSVSDSKAGPKLKTLDPLVSLQEVPGEISLIFQITGCPHKCLGCHSLELWPENGVDLTLSKFLDELSRYENFITCVCFFGGEWAKSSLIEYLEIAKAKKLKTCLYTGANSIHNDFYQYLNYLKTGPWVQSLGGLDSKNSNQIFYDLDKNVILNHVFQK